MTAKTLLKITQVRVSASANNKRLLQVPIRIINSSRAISQVFLKNCFIIVKTYLFISHMPVSDLQEQFLIIPCSLDRQKIGHTLDRSDTPYFYV